MTLRTDRLILRPFADADRDAYAAMMADPEVGYWLGATLSRAEADAQVDRFMTPSDAPEPGWLALEHLADGAFLGGACLRRVQAGHPLSGSPELGWRLAKAAWGFGYATESAQALIDFGFAALNLDEIVAFTAASNSRSRAVMARLGLSRRAELDFDHPALAPDHPLRAHVVYAVRRP